MPPKVAIVGRPNVGKSSLLNMLAGRRVSIVDPTAGVTRDRVATEVELPSGPDRPNRTIELIDTGGYGIEDSDNLTAEVERQIALALGEADLVLFVVDAQQGVLPLDETVARLLREANDPAPVMLLANKVDSEKHVGDAMEAAALGFGEPLCVSATTRLGKTELVDAILNTVDFDHPRHFADAVRPESGMLLAIVGKRNAGKSTLTNALAGSERVIVSEIEGTTRDSVDVRFQIGDKAFTAIDTAGIRKRKSVKTDIEYYSLHRALRSIRRADVVLLLLDATVPVSQVDRQLANEILKHYRPCIIVINKWDLVEKDNTQEEFAEYLDESLKGLSYAPIAFISARDGEGMEELMAMALNLYQQAGTRLGTGELNRVVEKIIGQRTPVSKVGKRPRVYYVTQSGVYPPTIAFFVNDPDLFDNNYQRFLMNRFRDELPYSEVPIRLFFRPRKRLPAEVRESMRKAD